MLSERELELRRNSLGASEIGVIAGHSMYRNATPFSVWHAKVFGETFDMTPAMEAGSVMEDGIATLYSRRMGDAKLRKGTRRVHGKDKWRSCTPDRYVLENDKRKRLLEIKWIGPGQDAHWDEQDEEGVPDMYRDQVDWQMDITGVHEADLCAFFAARRELHVWRFGFEQTRIDALLDPARRFWFEHVVPQIPPPLDWSEAAAAYLRKLFPQDGPKVIDAPIEAEEVAREYVRQCAIIKDAELEKETAKNRLCEMIGANAGIESFWGRATWKLPKSGRPAYGKMADQYREMLENLGVSKSVLDEVRERNTNKSRTFRCKVKDES